MGMGYQGFVKFYSGSTGIVILATGSSVNLVLEPIYSTAVWGAGWYNAATSAHYADNAIRFEGSVDFELQGAATIWDLLGDWFINERAYTKSVEISPDGARVYGYDAYSTSASISTSEGSFVTVSAGMVALDRTETSPSGGTSYSDFTYLGQKQGVIADACSDLALTNPLNPSGTNINPIPYWRTNAQLLLVSPGSYVPFSGGTNPQSGTETVEWSVDITQNETILYTCNGSRLPTAVLMGPMDVSGNVVLFNESGVFDPILGPSNTGSLTAPYMYAEVTAFRVAINNGTNDQYIEVPAVVVESDDYGIAGQDSVTNRTFSIKGLGGRCGPSDVTLPPCIMSDNTGAFVAP
jgi:hypothetical protein